MTYEVKLSKGYLMLFRDGEPCRMASEAEQELGRKIEQLQAVLREFIEEVPSSVEYSDWPELQAIVDRACAVLKDVRGNVKG
jgi:hypothetical protein